MNSISFQLKTLVVVLLSTHPLFAHIEFEVDDIMNASQYYSASIHNIKEAVVLKNNSTNSIHSGILEKNDFSNGFLLNSINQRNLTFCKDFEIHNNNFLLLIQKESPGNTHTLVTNHSVKNISQLNLGREKKSFAAFPNGDFIIKCEH